MSFFALGLAAAGVLVAAALVTIPIRLILRYVCQNLEGRYAESEELLSSLERQVKRLDRELQEGRQSWAS